MRASALLLWVALGVTSFWRTSPVEAQDLQYDENRRIYILTYIDTANSARRVEVMPPNHIQPALSLLIENSGSGTYAYQYEVSNASGALSTQSVEDIEIPCPADGAVLALEVPSDWVADYEFTHRLGSFICGFTATGEHATIAPGQRLTGFAMTSGYLPQIVEAAVWGGLLDDPGLPGLGEVGPELADLYSRAVGASGGWFSVLVVAPGRAPDEVGRPQQGIRLISTDLSRTCSIGWISQSGVCRSLQVKLDAAAASLVRGPVEGARSQLQSFLKELEAQHGPQPGKYVSDNAYWLLRTNVQYLLSRL